MHKPKEYKNIKNILNFTHFYNFEISFLLKKLIVYNFIDFFMNMSTCWWPYEAETCCTVWLKVIVIYG